MFLSHSIKNLLAFLLLFSFSFIYAQVKAKEPNLGRGVIVGKESVAYKVTSDGEPVPGAEIYIEIEPDDEPIANVTTDENGEFQISFSSQTIPYNLNTLPNMGSFIFIIKPTKRLAIKYNIDIHKLEKVRVKFNKIKDGKKVKEGVLVFKYELRWEPPTKTQNKGSFAVSGKSDA